MPEQNEKGGRGPIIISPETMARLEAVCSIKTGSNTGDALAKQFKNFIKEKLHEDLLGKVPAERWRTMTRPKREEKYRQFELFSISGRTLERAKEGKPLKRSSFYLLEEVIELYLEAYEVPGASRSESVTSFEATTAPTEKQSVPGEASTPLTRSISQSSSPASSGPPFSPVTISALSRRAALFCSNPHCRRLTSGPSLSNPTQAHNLGVACLIRGLQEGNPRYDPNQTHKADDIENGIWLCFNHAQLVNEIEGDYTAEMLLAWKQAHEELIGACLEGRKIVTFSMNQEEEEPAVAAAVIAFFDQQQVLYTRRDPMPQENITSGVADMRKWMKDQAALVMFDGRLEQLLDAIDRSCEAFQHIARHADVAMVEIGLAVLKKAIGIVLNDMSTHYKIPLPANVRTLIPDNSSLN